MVSLTLNTKEKIKNIILEEMPVSITLKMIDKIKGNDRIKEKSKNIILEEMPVSITLKMIDKIKGNE